MKGDSWATRVMTGVVEATALGFSKGPHLSRFAMYRALTRHRADPPPSARALSISGSQGLCRMLGFSSEQVTEAAFPEASILDLPFSNDTFDLLVSDQVLEHVEGDPRVGIAESLRVLKPGGVAVHTTCLINPIHFGPGDFWRFTPDGLRLLVPEDVEVVEAEGWGNRFACIALALSLRFVRIPLASWHPLHRLATWNDGKWLISTWIVLQKPSTTSS